MPSPAHLTAALLVLAGASAGAETLTLRDGETFDGGYAGTRDLAILGGVSIDVYNPEANYDGLTVTMADADPVDMSALLRFNVTAVPTDATVTSAALVLEVTNDTPDSYFVYEAQRRWLAGEATWKLARAGVPWATPGAHDETTDRGTSVLATLTGAIGSRTFPLNAAGVAVVQKWVNDPALNLGLVIQNYAAATGDAIAFASNQASTPRLPADAARRLQRVDHRRVPQRRLAERRLRGQLRHHHRQRPPPRWERQWLRPQRRPEPSLHRADRVRRERGAHRLDGHRGQLEGARARPHVVHILGLRPVTALG
jgi:hypothetical protein